MDGRQLLYIALGFVLVMGFASFGVASAQTTIPRLMGDGQAFETSGNADDTDPASPPAHYTGKGAASGVDAQSQAHSRPRSFNSLNGVAVAIMGEEPTGGVAKSNTDDTVTSKFEVAVETVCTIYFDTLAMATLESGLSSITASIEFVDVNRQLVIQDFKQEYRFIEKAASPDMINVFTGPRGASTLMTSIPDGGVIWDIDYSYPRKVRFKKGPHELVFNLKVDSEADYKASVNAAVRIGIATCA